MGKSCWQCRGILARPAFEREPGPHTASIVFSNPTGNANIAAPYARARSAVRPAFRGEERRNAGELQQFRGLDVRLLRQPPALENSGKILAVSIAVLAPMESG